MNKQVYALTDFVPLSLPPLRYLDRARAAMTPGDKTAVRYAALVLMATAALGYLGGLLAVAAGTAP